MKYQRLFPEKKNKKKYFKMTSDDFFPSMLSIETRQTGRTKGWT